jgi:hypothetical protein
MIFFPFFFLLLYESPVTSVIEGTGFHPFVVPGYRDGGLYESPVMSVIEGTGFHPLLSRSAGMVVTKGV